MKQRTWVSFWKVAGTLTEPPMEQETLESERRLVPTMVRTVLPWVGPELGEKEWTAGAAVYGRVGG